MFINVFCYLCQFFIIIDSKIIAFALLHLSTVITFT